MKIRPVLAWYDLWIGAFWDRRKRRLYVLPLPCIGFYIQFGNTPHTAATSDAAVTARVLRALAKALRTKADGQAMMKAIASGQEGLVAAVVTQLIIADQFSAAADTLDKIDA